MTRAEKTILIIALLGLVLSGVGWVIGPGDFYGAWLAALVLFAGWPLGSMAVLLIHSLTGGRWGEVLRPALLIGVRTMPLLLPAAVPLIFGISDLYSWAATNSHPANGFYLNPPFFAIRGAVYLTVWLTMGVVVLLNGGMTRFAPIFLFVLAITVSFAAIDTTMSLDPKFSSSVYGMLTGAGMGLLALSLAILLTASGEPSVRDDLGQLVLALVILWIYLDFMQLLIIWQSDLASEAPWYLDRSRGFWGALRILIAIGHFLLPMALLLVRRGRRSARVIVCVCGLLIATEILRAWWTVLPSLHRGITWIDLASIAGLGCFAVGFAQWTARRRPVLSEEGHHA